YCSYNLSYCSIYFLFSSIFFFFHYTSTSLIYSLSLHDALPISLVPTRRARASQPYIVAYYSVYGCTSRADTDCQGLHAEARQNRSEEHTSELQSRENLVCRLLLEKKNKKK